MKDTFSLKEIQHAINLSPKHKVKIKANPAIDDSHDSKIETIETDMFLFRLFGSNKKEFDNYKKNPE